MCLCDKQYLCFYCECFLKSEVDDLLKKYGKEILEDGDWWYGLEDYSVNIHCDEHFDDPNAIFNINIYRLGENGLDDYSFWFDLPPIKRNELEKL
jgi:hypothetical protein